MDCNIILSGLNKTDEKVLTSIITTDGHVIGSAASSFGSVKTLKISDVVYLKKGWVLKNQLKASLGYLNNADMDVGLSIYFLKSLSSAKGDFLTLD